MTRGAMRVIDSPVGSLRARAEGGRLLALEFVDEAVEDAAGGAAPEDQAVLDRIEAELAAYFADPGGRGRFTTPLEPIGTPFQTAVWRELLKIPAGQTRSYSDIARALGKPGAVRAVGRANGANPIAIVIPCHRVVRSDGSLCGYGGGRWRKERLLEHECAGALFAQVSDA